MIDLKLLISITGLALADAVNVCAFAILSMVLVAMLTNHPDKPSKILKAGLMFVLAVIIMYTFYGLVIFQLFSTLAENIQGFSPYLFNGLTILIMIIGALNIKDYFMYQPGGIATEMPLSIRPKVKLLIKKITTPWGAFVIGLLVTLFLLPCTMAPLIKAMDNLSALGYSLVTSLPWIIYYNLLFVLPMIGITLAIYFGFSKVEDVDGWKERNVRKLHLIAGILLFLVGFAILMKWL